MSGEQAAEVARVPGDVAPAIDRVRWGTGAPVRVADGLRDGRVQVAFAAVGAGHEPGLLPMDAFSPAERERAGRFLRSTDRNEFLMARSLVRSTLAQLLDVRSGEVGFEADKGQKPRLSARHQRAIDVSISHSHGWVVCAFAQGHLIGVDIEVSDPARPRELAELAGYILSDGERALWADLPAAQREALLLDAWRRKEALLKAWGVGLLVDPREVSVFAGDDAGRIAPSEVLVRRGVHWRVRMVEHPGLPTVAVVVSLGEAITDASMIDGLRERVAGSDARG